MGDIKLTFHKYFLASTTATEGTKFIITVQGVQTRKLYCGFYCRLGGHWVMTLLIIDGNLISKV